MLGLILGLLPATAAAIGAGFSRSLAALVEIKKRVLPQGTDPQSLRDQNPEFLDTRNLQVMPLEAFGTMGDREAPFDPDTWRLKVSGALRNPLDLTYGQLLSLPAVEREVLLVCPGVFANHGRWKGVSGRALLRKVGPLPEATRVTFYGLTESGERKESFNIQELQQENVFPAYAVNGRKLPPKHGFPLRVVAEGHWGYTWVKYVYKIELT
jgi:sulfoxide reductase catalytic subunit YedY